MFAVTSQSPEAELALGIEELEPMEAPSLQDFEAGVLIGLTIVAIGVALT